MTIETKIIFSLNHLFFDSNAKESFHCLARFIVAKLKNWFANVDFTIVGSGIVGLHCALALCEKYPESKILILEKGILPQGASTKNAGFACFGSISEILDDLKSHSEEEVIQLIQ
jgi:ribulose 1,5-bisphosphate synthetase/thiazole synthase